MDLPFREGAALLVIHIDNAIAEGCYCSEAGSALILVPTAKSMRIAGIFSQHVAGPRARARGLLCAQLEYTGL